MSRAKGEGRREQIKLRSAYMEQSGVGVLVLGGFVPLLPAVMRSGVDWSTAMILFAVTAPGSYFLHQLALFNLAGLDGPSRHATRDGLEERRPEAQP